VLLGDFFPEWAGRLSRGAIAIGVDVPLDHASHRQVSLVRLRPFDSVDRRVLAVAVLAYSTGIGSVQ
jgi:hypothetical protein